MSRNSSPPPRRRSRGSDPADEFVRLLKASAAELVAAEETVLLAVSGGADSIALLHGWIECRLPKPVVAHFDHRMRPGSETDAAFVAVTAATLGVPCEPGAWTDRPTESTDEDSARNARYSFLGSAAANHGCRKIATAHTRDDQAETILFRILRGTGIDGLAGIPRVRKLNRHATLIRPMLEIPRAAGRAFLQHRGLSWREDESNADSERTRNRIRRELMPLLADRFNPGIVEALVKLASAANDQSTIVSEIAERLWRSLPWIASPGEAFTPTVVMKGLTTIERKLMVRRLFVHQHWPMGRMNASHWEALAAVADEGGPVHWQGPQGLSALRTETSFVVRRRSS